MNNHIIALPLVQLEPQGKPEIPHRCGRCATPFQVTNPLCPNRPKEQDDADMVLRMLGIDGVA